MLLPTAIVSTSVILPMISKFISSYYVRRIRKIQQTPTIELTWGETATKPAKVYRTTLITKSLFRPHVQ